VDTLKSLNTLSTILTLPRRSTHDEPKRQQQAQAARQSYNLKLDMTDQFDCEFCRDTDLFVSIEGDASHCPHCHARRTLKAIRDLSRMTETEQAIGLSDIIINGASLRGAIDMARYFIAKPIGLITLYGTSGTAKTMIQHAIVDECLARNTPAVYITFYDLLEYIREAYSEGQSESAQRRLDKFADVKVLCIDELDKVKNTEWVQQLQTAIIDRRYRDAISNLTGTVIAMNGSIETLPDWIASRLKDGRAKRFELSGVDVRPLISE
jgi:DNA replication protein DnaC